MHGERPAVPVPAPVSRHRPDHRRGRLHRLGRVHVPAAPVLGRQLPARSARTPHQLPGIRGRTVPLSREHPRPARRPRQPAHNRHRQRPAPGCVDGVQAAVRHPPHHRVLRCERRQRRLRQPPEQGLDRRHDHRRDRPGEIRHRCRRDRARQPGTLHPRRVRPARPAAGQDHRRGGIRGLHERRGHRTEDPAQRPSRRGMPGSTPAT